MPVSPTAVEADRMIAIAQDIVQESCLRIPMTEHQQISQRQGIFVAASAVKEMCKYKPANGEGDTAKLILYCALVIEYATNHFATNPHMEMSQHRRCVLASTTILPLCRPSLTVLLSVLDKMEGIKDVLKCTEPVNTETHKTDLIGALAHVRLSHPTENCILTH